MEDMKFSRALIALMRSVVFKNRNQEAWESIIENRAAFSDYVEKMGLQLVIDEIDSYAYLKQVDNTAIPRLVPRHQLSYPVSLMLVILRKSMGEYDAANGDSRLILSKKDIVDKMRGFFQPQANEIKFVSDMERCIARINEMGFLRPLKDDGSAYEIEPVLRSFVTANWLNEFGERLLKYQDKYNSEIVENNPEGAELDGFI